MWLVVPVLSFAVFVWFVMRPHDFDTSAVVVSLIFVTLITYVSYLESRALRRSPSRTETFLATLWLWTRRTVAYGAASIFLGFAVVASLYLVYGPPDIGPARNVALILILLALAILSVWFGRVGRGYSYDYREDFLAHEKRKRRYQWKW